MKLRNMRRSSILLMVLGLAAPAAELAAQGFPTRPMRIIDAYPPGGASDFLARTLATRLHANLGQTVVIENRPGAGGNVGAEYAAKATPDGHTLFIGLSAALAPSVTLYPKLPYNVTKDFAPVSRVGIGVYVLVSHPSLPVKSVKELIALAKARPGALNYASAGNGSGPHLSGELLKIKGGVNLIHVPYKGGAPSVTAVLVGETETGFMSMAAALAQIRAGRLRPLGVSTPKRNAALPDVPAIAEAVPGYEVIPTFGIYAPAGTPNEFVSVLNRELVKILSMSDVRERFATQGVEAASSTPAELSAILAAEIAQWAKVIKEAGIRID